VSSRVVNVDIHGQRYAVRSDLDPQYIQELARFLDEKMAAAARELASNDPLRIAVIAALNISDELYRTRVDSQGADGRMRERAEEIERLIDAVLDEARIKVVNE
jgi:cell division protein ZapA